VPASPPSRAGLPVAASPAVAWRSRPARTPGSRSPRGPPGAPSPWSSVGRETTTRRARHTRSTQQPGPLGLHHIFDDQLEPEGAPMNRITGRRARATRHARPKGPENEAGFEGLPGMAVVGGYGSWWCWRSSLVTRRPTKEIEC
jgi:hypothetical protein